MEHEYEIGQNVIYVPAWDKLSRRRARIIGIIYTYNTTIYDVEFSNGTRDRIKEDQIIKVEEENEDMPALTGYTAVAVIEQGCYNKEYFYAIYPDGHDYIPDEKVLVSNNKDIWDIKEVITVEEAAERHKAAITAEIVCAVDTYAYEERVDNRKQAEKLKKEMDKMIKQMDETMKYNMYAEKNPELKKKLDEYKKLTGK